jgi:hypothetical protein
MHSGEAFGKGETAFTIFCKKKNQSTKNTQPEELGLENTAFEKSIPNVYPNLDSGAVGGKTGAPHCYGNLT